MSDCCTRKTTWKDILFLPFAISCTLVGFCTLLGIEMAIAYSLGLL